MNDKKKFGQIEIKRKPGEMRTVHIECDCPGSGDDITGIGSDRVYVPLCGICDTRRGWFVKP